MRHSSRFHLVSAATIVSSLAALFACTESGIGPAGPASAHGAVPTVAAPSVVLNLDTGAREIAAGASILLSGWVALTSTGEQLQTPIVWSTPGPAIVALWSIGPQAVRITALEPGVTTVQAGVNNATRSLAVTVLPVTSQPSTLVAVDFRMLEVQIGDSWEYAPQLVLRDESAKGGSALIAVKFEVPGLGATPSCAMVRPVGPAPVEIFHEMYGDFELAIGGGALRASAGDAIARLTVRTGDGTAATLVLRGPIVPGSLPTTYSSGLFSGALACG